MERKEYDELDGNTTSRECYLCCCYCFRKKRNTTKEQCKEKDGDVSPDSDTMDFSTFSTATSVESAWQALQTMLSDEGESPGLGRLHFTIRYDFNKRSLTVEIHEAENLPAMDVSGTSDPYVKAFLLPARHQKLTTNVQHKTLNPRWNEVFVFEDYPFEKIVNSNLCLRVLDYDRFSRDDIIGEVIIPMIPSDLVKGQTMWKYLQPTLGHAGRLGELNVSLCYDSTRSCLTVIINRARNLKAKDIIGTSDPYVKVWLIQNGRRIEKKKTPVLKRTLDPQFNETMTFNVSVDQMRYTSLQVHVMDYDRIGRNEEIGRVVLGPKTRPSEVKHWNEMLSKAKLAATRWHVLRDCN